MPSDLDGNGYKPVKKAAPRKVISADTAERNAVYTPWQAKTVAAGDPNNSYDEWLNQQAGGGQYRAQNPTPTTLPTSQPAGQGTSGGSAGGGGAAAAKLATENALRTMFSAYGTNNTMAPDDGKLAAALSGFVDQAKTTGNAATASLQQMLGGQSNAYTNTFAAPQVASNPLAAYMQASGAGTDQVNALQQMLAATSQQSASADQMMNDRQAQSWNNQQAGRQADATAANTSFQQQLAASNGAAQSQIASKRADEVTAFNDAETKRKNDMMMQILQMAVSGGVDLNSLGINFDQAAPK
jgi:hypothetical protein